MLELNEIYEGDCLEVMKEIDDKSIDMILTSPPYDNLRTYNEYTFDFENVAKELFRIIKDGGVVVWIINDATINGSETGTSFKHALYFKDLGFNIHDTMIWEKPAFTATGALKTRYAQVFEYMFIFTKNKIKTFNPIKDRPTKGPQKIHGSIRQKDNTTKKLSNQGKIYGDKLAQRYNVWKMTQETSKSIHPARFPEILANDHILSWSNPCDIILDPLCGSGTTCKMALKNNRYYLGIDISAEYVEIAKKRIKDWCCNPN